MGDLFRKYLYNLLNEKKMHVSQKVESYYLV